MDEDVKAQFHAGDIVIKRIDDEIVRVRERLHKLESDLPVVKLNMNDLATETKQQTPLLREVHTAVLGPEGLGEKVRHHDRYLHRQTQILLGLLMPLLATIALATCYGAFSKKQAMSPADVQQIVEIIKAQKP